MKYASLFTAALFTSIVLSPSAQTQERLASPLLPKIYATFRAADLDRDGDLTLDERNAVGLPKEDSKAFDLDGDGLWCEGEFVLYYRRLLKRNGKKIDRALNVEAGRINRAYKDATNRGLNRDAAQRAADAVRAGTVKAAQESEREAAMEGEAPSEEVIESNIQPGMESSEFSSEFTFDATSAEPALEPSLPVEPSSENEGAVTGPEEPQFEQSVENDSDFEQPVAVPPAFEIPSWGPTTLEPEASQTGSTEFGELETQESQPQETAGEEITVEPMPEPFTEEDAQEAGQSQTEEFQTEEEPSFIVPEFTRPDWFSAPEGEFVPVVVEAPAVEPGSEAPEQEATEIEEPAQPAPSSADQFSTEPETQDVSTESVTPVPSEGTSTFDVFGEPTVELPVDSESTSVQGQLEESTPALPVETETAPLEPGAPSEVPPTKEEDRPLTDMELDQLRQEQDDEAVRNRYGFIEPEESELGTETNTSSEGATDSSAVVPVVSPKAPASGDSTSDGTENSSAAESDGLEASAGGTEKAEPETTPQGSPVQETETPESGQAEKSEREKPLSLWERAERARKLREQRKEEDSKPQEPAGGADSESSAKADEKDPAGSR